MTLALCLLLATRPGVPTDGGLRDLADRRRLTFGAAMPIDLIRNGAEDGKFSAAALRNFNLIEPENDFKMAAFAKGPDEFDWTRTDYLLGAPGQKGWAQQNKMKVRGHVLVYASDSAYGTPAWFRTRVEAMTREEARAELKKYIYTVVGRYKGKIAMWDVVNEAIDDAPNNRPFNLRDSLWFRKLGPDFLVDAFNFAKEADPRAELYYNDYGIEYKGKKADNALALVNWVRSRGAKVTGIGMQWHIMVSMKPNPGDGFYEVAQRIKDNKLAFMLTELDVAMPVVTYPRTDPRFGLEPKDPADLTRQAEVYRSVLAYALAFRNCRGVNVWGVTDAHSWIPGFSGGRTGVATLLDKDYQPKPAYHALAGLLSEKR